MENLFVEKERYLYIPPKMYALSPGTTRDNSQIVDINIQT
jgi:hypothetical protein